MRRVVPGGDARNRRRSGQTHRSVADFRCRGRAAEYRKPLGKSDLSRGIRVRPAGCPSQVAQHVQSKLRDDGDYDAAGDGDGRHPAVDRAECPSHPLVETALAGIVQGHGPEQRDFPIVFELLGETPTCCGNADLYFQ